MDEQSENRGLRRSGIKGDGQMPNVVKSGRAYLNLGCGNRFDSAWTNIDFTPSGDSVIGHNLLCGIPFPAETFEVVYHSHLLEHFPRHQAPALLGECFRVLRQGGIIRVAVPDLERIARGYLEALASVATGDRVQHLNYEWMKLELYDQVVREQPGGEIGRYLSDPAIENRDFVLERLGVEAKRIMGRGVVAASDSNGETKPVGAPIRFARRLYRLLLDPFRIREALIQLLLGGDYELLQLGRFRRGGEIHQWMYDSYSLGRHLQSVGFTDCKIRTATESLIPDWPSFNLDTEPDGALYKPDSLYMEAIKA